MRILAVTNHFWPESFRINDLAVGLVERGHEVTVLTGIPNYPEGRFYSGYGLFQRRRETHQGVRIVRVPLVPRGKGRPWNLVLNYGSSALMSCVTAPLSCREPYDVIFVFETSPVTVALAPILLRQLRSVPIVMWVLDLWPESLSATGAVSSPTLLAEVRRLVRFIYAHCDRILVSSRGFEQSIRAMGGYDGPIGYFPNWVEPDYLARSCDDAVVLPTLPEGFRVMFAGNIGAAQDFPTILAAAERLRDEPDIHWVIVGDGRAADWVRAEVGRRGLERQVHLVGRYPAAAMPGLFEKADALLLTLRREPIFALTVPGKLQSYLASGRPVIAGLDGEGAELVRGAQAGLACPAESPAELAELVRTMSCATPADRQAMGERGQRYCLEHFDREKLFDSLEQVLEEVSAKHEAH